MQLYKSQATINWQKADPPENSFKVQVFMMEYGYKDQLTWGWQTPVGTDCHRLVLWELMSSKCHPPVLMQPLCLFTFGPMAPFGPTLSWGDPDPDPFNPPQGLDTAAAGSELLEEIKNTATTPLFLPFPPPSLEWGQLLVPPGKVCVLSSFFNIYCFCNPWV